MSKQTNRLTLLEQISEMVIKIQTISIHPLYVRNIKYLSKRGQSTLTKVKKIVINKSELITHNTLENPKKN